MVDDTTAPEIPEVAGGGGNSFHQNHGQHLSTGKQSWHLPFMWEETEESEATSSLLVSCLWHNGF